MSNCEICDQELVEGNFEEELGICINCILIDCREDSFKSFLIVFLIFIGWLVFIAAFFSVIFIVGSLFVDFEGYIFYMIPPLIVCLVCGPGLIYLTVVFKFR